jgi:hypothetical protein
LAVVALQVHAPAKQMLLPPQEAPSATFVPVSVQTGDPVEHEIVPVWQELAGVQAPPATQEPQVPLLQNLLVPHDVPFFDVSGLPATHWAVPDMHEIVPSAHMFDGVHAAPETQLTSTSMPEMRAWSVTFVNAIV